MQKLFIIELKKQFTRREQQLLKLALIVSVILFASTFSIVAALGSWGITVPIHIARIINSGAAIGTIIELVAWVSGVTIPYWLGVVIYGLGSAAA
jgi:hypothetical protein